MPRLTLRLLGPPLIELDGEPAHLGRHKATALLAYLALTQRSHSRDALAALLWPELDQSRARAEVRRTLSLLSRTLGNQWFAIDRERAGWAEDAGAWVDVAALRERLAACESHGHPSTEACAECVPLLTEAVDLYRDGFLAGFTLPDSPAFDEWQFFETESLRDDVAGALERLARWCGMHEEYDAAIAYARRWLSLDPLHEPAHWELMALYARSGQRAAALRQYAECERMLQEELGIAPGAETTRLHEAIRERRELLRTRALTAEPSIPRRHNLPAQVTPFVGRQEVLADIGERLADPGCRLLTLVGPGGMGKTRLALQTAHQAMSRFPAGCWWVDLAPLPAGTDSSRAVAAALGAVEQPDRPLPEVIADSLQGRELFLILDNCEHVVDGAAHLAGLLLSRCPQLTVLATSREPLHVPGEQLLDVPPMALPGAEEPAQRLLQADAVQLFAQRAAAVRSDFSLEQNAALVGDLCRRLDGMPLAIELAAARLRALSLETIARHLDDRFRLLTGGSRTALPRQRTLRDTVEWSFRLLEPAEQALFDRLSVFAAGFDLEAAEAVCSDASIPALAVLDGLSSLVDQSLVSLAHGEEGAIRYRLLETLRAYGREQLAARGETAATAARHAQYYLALAETLEPVLAAWERELLTAYARLDAETDNLAAAMRWSLASGEPEVALRIGGALRWWLWMRPQLRQYAEWLECALAQQGEGDPGLRARALGVIHTRSFLHRDDDEQYATAEAELKLAHRSDNLRLIGRAAADLALAAVFTGRHREQVPALCHEALRIGREYGDRKLVCDALGGVALLERDPGKRHALVKELLAQAPYCHRWFPMWHLGIASAELGDLEQSEAWYQRALQCAVELGSPIHQVDTMWFSAYTVWRRGDHSRAMALFERSLDMKLRHGDRRRAANTLVTMGHVAYERGEYRSAKQYYEQSHALYVAVGWAWAMGRLQQCLGNVAQALGEWEQAERHHRQALACYEKENAYWTASTDVYAFLGGCCGIPVSLQILGDIALAKRSTDEAKDCFRQALQRAGERPIAALHLHLLLGPAKLLAQEGRSEWAVALAALARHHPESIDETREKAGLLLDALQAEMDPDHVEAAQERGQARDLWATVEELLAELEE